MTDEDIIRMAREAGFAVSDVAPEIGFIWCSEEYPIDEEIYRFAELVAAAEREACAMLCEEPYDLIQITDDCSEYVYKDHLICADAIRARGKE